MEGRCNMDERQDDEQLTEEQIEALSIEEVRKHLNQLFLDPTND